MTLLASVALNLLLARAYVRVQRQRDAALVALHRQETR